MKAKIYKYGFVTLMALMMAGCATYRTNSDISFDSTIIDAPKTVVIITIGTIGHRKYKEIGEIEAKVKKIDGVSPRSNRGAGKCCVIREGKEARSRCSN